MALTTPGYDFNPYTGLRTNRKKQPFTGSFTGSLGTLPPGQSFQGGLGGGGQTLDPINLPGFTPDYKSLITQALGPLTAQLGAEGSADLAGRNSALIRGLTQFGEQFDPSGAQAAFGQDFYNQAGLGDILPQANALAAENTKAGFSVAARQKSAFERSVQQIRDALAARGLLRSGATGVALQGAQKEFETGQYDARQQLADYAASVQQGYVAAQRQRAAQLEAAQREEAERQARLNPPTGSRTVNPGEPDYPVQKVAPLAPTPPLPPVGPTQIQTDPFAALQAALRRGREQRIGF